MNNSGDLYDKIVELARRRGFFWQAFEIYGGVAGFYELGPLGIRLKKNIEDKWREWFIRRHQEYVVEIESPMITPSKVFEASGHVEHFTDPIVECLKCGRVFRADHLVEGQLGIKAESLTVEELDEVIRKHGLRCPVCGGELSKVRLFNLLFQTTIGPYKGNTGYLRPEAAQGMFVAFKRVYDAMRAKLPIGIAQIGRVARNEISPRQGMMRLREFTIMEVEFFFDPEEPECPLLDRVADTKIRILRGEAKERGEEKPEEFKVSEAVEEKIIINPWLAYWMTVARDFVHELGVPYENMYFDEKLPHERAHYASQTFDQMVKVSRWKWVEVSGHAYRGDYDLSRHMKYSGQDLRVFKRYPQPRIVKKKTLKINKALIGRTYKEKAKEILGELEKLSLEEVEKALKEKGYVKVKGYKIGGDAVQIVEVEEKITGKHFIPHVVEPSFGAERLLYVTLEYAYHVRNDRVVLRLPRDLAPIQVAVFPLLSKPKLVEKAREVYRNLVARGFYTLYDESGTIGRRYARADEIGVPAAVTIDYQTLEDDTVTLRDRDTWEQIRIPSSKLVPVLQKFIYGNLELKQLEKLL